MERDAEKLSFEDEARGHRQNSFDLVRLYAALLVLAGHAAVLLGLAAPVIFNRPVHQLGVEVFFAVSGYLITQSIQRDRNPFRFFAKRAMRIFPALWVCVTVTILLGWLITSHPKDRYPGDPMTIDYLWNYFLNFRFNLPGVFDDNIRNGAVNGTLWTLAPEVMLYVAFYLFLQLGRWGFIPALLAQAVVSYVAWRGGFHIEWWGLTATSLAPLSTFFLLGSAMAMFRIPRSVPTVGVLLLLLGLFQRSDMDWIASAVIAYSVITLGELPSRAASILTSKVGDLSYGMYLYGYLLQQVIIMLFRNAIDVTSLMVLSTLASGGVAYLSWHFIEAPALRLKPGRRSRQEPVLAPQYSTTST